MKTPEDKLMKRIGIDFDGWVVEAADGEISPFEYENDVEKTIRFFGFGKRRPEKVEAGHPQPA